jgi:hypothetical protein
MANEVYIYFRGKAPKRRIAKTSRDLLREARDADPRHQAIDAAKYLARDEKARRGIDGLTRDLVQDDIKAGKFPCESDCRQTAQAVAERAERKVDG